MVPLIIVITLIAIVGIIMLKNKGPETQNNNVIVVEQPTVSPTESTETLSPSAGVDDKGGLDGNDGTKKNEDSKTIQIEAGSFYYKPNVITVKKGQKVKIVMKSVDMMHNFNIDELNVQIPITKSGETGTVEFIPNKVGTYEYYCSVEQHRANGQVGKLIVQ